MPTRQDLEPSQALSIVERGPKRFEGRKLGILVTDGVDAMLVNGPDIGDCQGESRLRADRAEGRRRPRPRMEAGLRPIT